MRNTGRFAAAVVAAHAGAKPRVTHSAISAALRQEPGKNRLTAVPPASMLFAPFIQGYSGIKEFSHALPPAQVQSADDPAALEFFRTLAGRHDPGDAVEAQTRAILAMSPPGAMKPSSN